MEKASRILAGDEALVDAKESERNTNANSSAKKFDSASLLANTSVPYLTRIAENGSVPSSMLEQLASHTHPSVREAVADNINTPIDTLWVLSRDQCEDIRYAMAENHNLPLAILDNLSQDQNPYIAHRAERTLSRLLGGIVLPGDFGEAGDDSGERRFMMG